MTIEYNDDMWVTVNGLDDFAIALDGGSLAMDRAEMEWLRSAIDQALNTSAEELGDELA